MTEEKFYEKVIWSSPQTDEELLWLSEIHELLIGESVENYEVTETTLREAFAYLRECAQRKNYLILLGKLKEEEEPIAMLMAHLRRSPRDTQKECYVDAIYVGEEFRRRGVGKYLLERVIKWGTEKGVQRLKVAISLKNDLALKLFESVGGQRTFVEMDRSLP